MSAGAAIWYENWNHKSSMQFDMWWIKEYGEPSEFGAEDLETDAADEYYRRKSFALMGWLAMLDMTNKVTELAILDRITAIGYKLDSLPLVRIEGSANDFTKP